MPWSAAVRVMRFIRKKGWEASGRLAEERGSFPNYKGSTFDEMDQAYEERHRNHHRPDGDDLHNRRVFFGHRAALRARFYEERNGRYGACRGKPSLQGGCNAHGGFDDPETMKKIAEGGHLYDIEGVRRRDAECIRHLP